MTLPPLGESQLPTSLSHSFAQGSCSSATRARGFIHCSQCTKTLNQIPRHTYTARGKPVSCVMCALCPLAAFQPVVSRELHTQNSPLPPSHLQEVLQALSSTMITWHRPQQLWYITRLVHLFWIGSLIFCCMTNSSKTKTMQGTHQRKAISLFPQMFH